MSGKINPLSSGERPQLIGGYNRWDVEEASRTLKKAEEVKSDKKFLKVVLAYMEKDADKTEKTADLLRNTSSKLKGLFGGKKQ